MMVLLAFCSTGQIKEGYEITLNISGLRDSTLFLAYHLGDKQYISDTTRLDNNGKAVFREIGEYDNNEESEKILSSRYYKGTGKRTC
jgi:hypothetical protein